jgi:hypothetical protein
MESLFQLFIEYGPYLGLALGINAIMVGLKVNVAPKFFSEQVGAKFLWMIPLALGLLGGFLLGGDSVKQNLLTGLGIGATSHYFYKFVTKTLDRGVKNVESKEDVDLGQD